MEPPMSVSLPHPATNSVVNPHGGSDSAGRHTGRTVDGYVLAVNGVLSFVWERHSIKFKLRFKLRRVQNPSKRLFLRCVIPPLATGGELTQPRKRIIR